MSLPLLSTSDLHHLMDRFDQSELVDSGSAFVLTLDAIRDRSGGRWDLRRDIVREFAERQFLKFFGDEDALVPLDEVNFLLVQSGQTEFSAQSRALKLLRTILEYFLGACESADVRISQVGGIGADGLLLKPIEFSDAQLAQIQGIDWAERDRGTTLVTNAAAAGLASASMLASAADAAEKAPQPALVGDRAYNALFLTEPVWGVQQKAVVSSPFTPTCV